MIIAFFHFQYGKFIAKKIRYSLYEVKSKILEYCDFVEGTINNLYYFMSNDVNSIILNLKNENIKQQIENENLKNLQEENQRLKKLLSFKKSSDISVIIARVIASFSNSFTKSCILNLGKGDNLSEGEAVRTSEGLIGRIAQVDVNTSCILLITDMNSCIPVRIGNVDAMMVGNNSDYPQISALRDDVTIPNGSEVKTAGYGICENIPVGKIDQKEKILFVKPYANFNCLKYVFVLKEQ
ncbi:MAG: rod shape-determining protein MreC [Holosporaceae bacterium]|nr:rod shape-determining protein MreC [Holosporaceae bacterium]